MKLKFNQNAFGEYGKYEFNSTMTKLTVNNAPIWAKDKHNHWVQLGTKKVTVGVVKPRDFDFEALLHIAVNHPKDSISA